MPARIAGFAASSNQTLQFQHPRPRAFLPQINRLLVVQGRLHRILLPVRSLARRRLGSISAAHLWSPISPSESSRTTGRP
jgi:hypothetical protein